MHIRKLLAGGLAATMAGAGLAVGAVADLGDYVDVGTGGALDSPRIVIGSSAGSATEYPKDVAAAGDIAAAMASQATTTVNIAGGATTSVTGGSDIATTNKKLYFRSYLNRARSTLTQTQLPTLLASGTASVDLSGVYSFDQYLELGTKQTEFDRNSGIFTDPELYIDIGYNSILPAYNLSVVFTKALNITHADVQGGSITIANVMYTIGSGSQSGTSGAAADSKLVLLGGAGSTVVDEGGSATIVLENIEHTAEVSSVADTSTAVVVIDGKLKEVTEGTTYSITGDQGTIDVYIKGVYYAGTTGTGTSRVELVLGSSKLTFDDRQTAKSGTSEDSIQGTHVYIVGDDTGVSKITISVAGAEAGDNYVTASEPFWDPVFGSFQLAFDGMTPVLDDSSRDTITIDNSGTNGATVAITDYRGYSKTFQWAYNGTGNPQLNYSSTRAIHVLEGETVSLNDYVLITPEQESDFGHILQLTAMTNIDGSEPRFVLTDAMSDTAMTFYFSSSASNAAFTKTFYVDGQTYYGYNVSGTQKMNFTWGDSSASDGDSGAKTTVFPLVRLAGGEYITFVQNQSINSVYFNSSSGTSYTNVTDGSSKIFELPGGDLNISMWDGKVWVNNTVWTTLETDTDGDYEAEFQAGQITYYVGLKIFSEEAGAAENYTAVLYIKPSATYLERNNNERQIGVLMFQEADNTTTTKDAIITGLDFISNSIAVEQLAAGITGIKDGETQTSDAYVTDYLNTYGTQVSYSSTSASGGYGKVDIKYPDDQGIVTVAFGIEPAFSTAAIGGSYDTAYQVTEPVMLLDNEVSGTSSLPYDLILVGGPCANTLVAALLTGVGETCSDWSYDTGLIKEVSDAFGSGQKALIIAGTNAADTRSLAAQVLDGTMAYAV